MAPVTRSHSRYMFGEHVKNVLEQPPILCTLVDILEKQNCSAEACSLKLVLKSCVSNDVIDKAFYKKRYMYHFNIATKERHSRFMKTLSRLIALNTTSKRKDKIKTTLNLFKYLVLNKDLVNLPHYNKLKAVIIFKIQEFVLDPSVTEKMNQFYMQLFN